MVPNLDEQYDRVIAYIDGFHAFAGRVWLVCSSAFLSRQRFGMFRRLVFGVSLKAIWEIAPRDVLSERAPASRKPFFLEFTPAAERTSDYFAVLISDYATDTLSDQLISAFPEYNFETLVKLHELKEKNLKLEKYGAKTVLGFILGALALLLKSVPKAEANLWHSSARAREGKVGV
jgi:hypothetical protein